MGFSHAVTGHHPPDSAAGVEVMKRLKDQIAYTGGNTAKGAQVRIVTKNAEALVAVHEFLRFQIQDHRTGDPLDISPD